MRELILGHLQGLLDERDRLRKYLRLHHSENTMIYAAVQLGLAWCDLKLAFWSSVVKTAWTEDGS